MLRVWHYFKRRKAVAGRVEAPVPLEKDVQKGIVLLYNTVGCSVYNLSQPRKTMQTPGLPDLLIFHERTRTFWLHEVKRPGGKLRPAQVAFQALCALCGVPYIVGGLDEAIEQVQKVGAAHRVGITVRRA